MIQYCQKLSISNTYAAMAYPLKPYDAASPWRRCVSDPLPLCAQHFPGASWPGSSGPLQPPSELSWFLLLGTFLVPDHELFFAASDDRRPAAEALAR